MAGTSPAMTQINSMAFFWGYCHKKRREIKPEQLGPSAKRLIVLTRFLPR
jgi:hypothetical protein